SSVETLEFVPKPAVNEPKAASKPKVWFDAPIIEEYELDISSSEVRVSESAPHRFSEDTRSAIKLGLMMAIFLASGVLMSEVPLPKRISSMSNQTNELKNMMASFFQMNTASTSGTGSLPSNTIANSKGELKAITTRSGLVLDGPFVPMPPPFINPKEDERVEETLTDPELA
ncbi:hypothetical protein Tco_0141682, partial [Tanacetum coccineum]